MTTATLLMKLADAKMHVTGTYYGVFFAGIVTESRQLNWSPDYPEQITVELDQPVIVFGGKCRSIHVNSRQIDDGTHTLGDNALAVRESMTW